MVTVEQVYNFLLQHYKPSRFQLRDGPAWGHNYSLNIAKDRHNCLAQYGFTYISCHESRSGQTIKFDAELNILEFGDD